MTVRQKKNPNAYKKYNDKINSEESHLKHKTSLKVQCRHAT